MSVFSYFASLFSGNSKTKSSGSNNRRTKYLNLRAGLILLFIGGVSFIVVKSGAQELQSSDTKKKTPKYINLDIRVNEQGKLAKVIQDNVSGGKISSSAAITEMAREQAVNINEVLDELKKENPTVEAKISPLTGSIEVLRSATSLTEANYGVSGNKIVENFIQQNKKLYGLEDQDIADLNFVGESSSEVSGMRMVIVEQKVNDRTVFQSDTKFILDRDGRLIQSVGRFVPKAAANAAALYNLISPQEALRATMATVDVTLGTENMETLSAEPDGLKAQLKVDNPAISGEVTSTIVYFPAAPGVLIPAWSQTIFGKDADYYALVDATDGTLLYRKNIRADASTQQARFRVYVQADGSTPADSPAPQSPTTAVVGAGTQYPGIAPTIVNMSSVQNITASPNGWIDDCPAGGCTATQTQTQGNNTITCMDRAGTSNQCDTDAASVLDGNGMPTGNPDSFGRNRDFLGTVTRDFQTNYLPPPQGGNPEAGQTATGAGSNGTAAVDQFRRGMVTHLFYLTNFYHDRLYSLGFTPAARNFQNNNFGGGGAENDRVLGDAQDLSGTNNANFSAPADGTSGRMQMYVFDNPTIDRDGSLDAEIVLHELTHGLSNRLIGNGAGLNWAIGRGMGEGWSDFYALSLLNNTNADNPNGRYASGAYATYKLTSGTTVLTDNYVYGIRRFPYSTDNTVNPLTWADVDQVTYNESGGIAPSPLDFGRSGALEVHNSGEIWMNTLWEVRSRVIADPAGANGSVPTGNTKMLGIVTDALKLTPTDPSFIEARNALIDADCATNACANENSIWAGFADRGLGYNAVAPLGEIFGYASGHMGIKESFQTPNLDINGLTINDTTLGFGNSSGSVDAGETVKLTVNLKNPLRRASSSATGITTTLSTSTPGVTILDNASAYSTIAAQGNGNGDTFTFSVSTAMPCGSSLKFTLTTNSSLGTSTKDFVIRLGAPSGTGAPITYTSTIAGGLAIPDNAPKGVTNTLSITDDYEIADLNFRVNSLTHTFDGDLTVMLKSPAGYGTDLISAIGGGVSSGGSGDNLTNMVIDQTAAAPNDQLLATNAQAPYTDDFLPVFDSPSFNTFGFPTDPTGQLNRFNGLSTQGNWTVLVSDIDAGDTGTLNGWSMIVTPRAFTCTPFTPTGVEGDVQSRPNGDGEIQSNDVVQVTRFVNELDTPSITPNEFQRADSAPLSSAGNGLIDSGDIIQTRRYLNELDALRIANGQTAPNGGKSVAVADSIVSGKSVKTFDSKESGKVSSPDVAPELRVESTMGSAGNQVSINIRVDAVGNEAQYAFAVLVDPNVLTFAGFAAGGTTSQTFSCNGTATAGRVRCSIGAFTGNQAGSNTNTIGEIAPGNNQILIKVNFTVAANAQSNSTTAVNLGSQSASDDSANSITPATTNGTVTIAGATAGGVTLGGRALTSNGRGIGDVSVTLTNAAGGTRTTRTTAFGYYRFEEVEAGQSYIITATAKRYTFSRQTQVLNLNADNTDVNFIAENR